MWGLWSAHGQAHKKTGSNNEEVSPLEMCVDIRFGACQSAPTTFSIGSCSPLQPQVPSNCLCSNSSGMVKPCKFFLEGFCRDGRACKFLHQEIPRFQTEQDARGRHRNPPPLIMREERPPARGRKRSREDPPRDREAPRVCKFWRQGFCRDGNACPFLHDAAPEPPGVFARPEKRRRASPPRSASRGSQRPEAPIDKECRFWLQGRCRDGDRCRYLHLAREPAPPLLPGDSDAAAKYERTCRFWASGNCRDGESCPFMHCFVEVVPVECPEMVKTGSCKFGDACRFLHSGIAPRRPRRDSPPRGRRRESPRRGGRSSEPPVPYEAVTNAADLPPGWEMRETADGQKYYLNHNTRKTQWNRPGRS